MTFDEFDAECAECAAGIVLQQAQAMVYQYSLKVSVARYLGVTWQSLDLPYAEWATIRDAYLRRLDA